MLKKSRPLFCLLAFCLFSALNAAAAEKPVPESWKTEWNSPSASMRPLQIIHGGVVHYDTPEKMAYFKDQCGLGGIVCNVGPKDYLYNEDDWTRFVDAVKSARQLGLRVWIYDEDGYPSPEAGGVVLRGHPELESIALVYDPERTEEPIYTRPAYEFTHASNNYAAARRYPNPLHSEMTKRFLEVTHKQYRDRLGKELFEQVEAFFTDEPSLNAVNIGQIPEESRKNVRVDDPLDPNLKLLPMIAWNDDLPKLYKEKYGEDLMPLRKSLFEGDTDKDKQVRQNYWRLVGELNRDRFYGGIQDWCRENGSSVPTPQNPNVPFRIASSGHTLHEEPTHAHVPLDGNKIDVLMKMDVPGMDMLNSDPKAVVWGAWRAAAFPWSAAFWTNRRLVMTEISDFSQQMGGQGEASLDAIRATASWQAAWGVTEFTLYYGIKGRGEAVHKQYCDYVGRLNAVLRDANMVPEAVLYYPIEELQAEYMPQTKPLDLQKMSPRTRQLVNDFEQAGRELVESQIPFVLSDTTTFSEEPFGKHGYRGIVTKPSDVKKIQETKIAKIEPKSTWVVLGRFERDSRNIFLLLNTDDKPYSGKLRVPVEKRQTWSAMNPENGDLTELTTENENENDTISVQLAPRQTLIFVGK